MPPPIGREPSQDVLKQWFQYDHERGCLLWFAAPWNQPSLLGAVAGSRNADGYWYISFQGNRYLRHRLIWILLNGPIPSGKELDHRDTDNENDRIENLRLATSAEQKRNTKRYRNNKSGFKGVSFHVGHGKWRAEITVDRKKKTIGYFNTAELAHAAYVAEAEKHFGEFARSA